MADVRLDHTGNVVFSGGDVELVTGREEFEQRLREWVQYRSTEVIGEATKPENALDMIRVYAERIAQDYEHISDTVDISARQTDNPRQYELNVYYQVDGESRFYPLIANL